MKKEARPYTEAENAQILEMAAGGYSRRTIACRFGRTEKAVNEHIRQLKKKNKVRGTVVPPPLVKGVEKMTPREMIKALYDMGYRIENNNLVFYQKTVVKLEDVVRGL